MTQYANRIKYVSWLLIMIGLLALAKQLPTDQIVQWVTSRVETANIWSAVYFALIYVVATVLLVPGAPLTLVAGAVFGLVWGMVIVSIASTTASAVAFLIGRYLARDSVQRWAKRYPRFMTIDHAVAERGWWKIIALLRLSPVVPFNASNYLFGLTSASFWSYTLTSWWAMLPGTLMYVYFGYAGRVGLVAASQGQTERGPGQWAMLLIGLLATVTVITYITWLARRAILEQTPMRKTPETQTQSLTSTQSLNSDCNGNIKGAVVSICLATVILTAAACVYLRPGTLQSLFGPPSVTPTETYADQPDGIAFDHSVLNALLKQYVDPDGWVDYAALVNDTAKLDRYIQHVGQAPFDQLGRDAKLALLINAYNAFTLRLILDYYPLRSIKDIPAAKRWDDRRWQVGNQTWSLNQIEHEQVRPHFKEPRIHFALVCAAVGCPPLRNEAYTADRLEEQLEAQSRYVHSHDRWFRYDADQNTLWLTSLYNWYGGDFEQAAGSIIDFAARYAPPNQSIDNNARPAIRWLDYDWALNSRENAP